MVYRRRTVSELCAGCGGPTRSSTGYCAVQPWCRTMAQRLSYSNQARAQARKKTSRPYVRQDKVMIDLGIRDDLTGLSDEQYDRRCALVQKILEHKAAYRKVSQ